MNRRSSNPHQILSIFHILGLLLGTITTLFFWWSWIGIAIGLILFVFDKDPVWRRHGMILALSAGLATFIVENMEEGMLKGVGIAFGLIVMIPYITGAAIFEIVKKVRKIKPRRTQLKIPKQQARALQISLLILPMMLWSSVSVNFQVMFNNTPSQMWIHAESSATPGERITLTVQAWDKFERLSAIYDGEVSFDVVSYNLTTMSEISSPNVSLPEDYNFNARSIGSQAAYRLNNQYDNGMKTFNISIDTEGYHYIRVTDSITENTYYSNPIYVKSDINSTSLRVYWGDLHSHSMLSDGSGSATHSFDFARRVARLDYYALTDHGEQLSLYGLSNSLFKKSENAANAAYKPNLFVTFHGVEYTSPYMGGFYGSYGHYTCITSGDEIPIIATNIQTSTDTLWAYLDQFCADNGVQAMAIPHHAVRNAFIQDWTYANPKYVRMAEVTSVHGECLFDPHDSRSYRGSVDMPPEPIDGAAIMDAFDMGHQMVLMGNGDNHDGHPGHSLSHTAAYIGHQYPYSIWHPRNAHPYPGGLTAVYAGDLTRAEIFANLYGKKVYSTSDHGRPFLNFTINGIGIGNAQVVNVSTPTSDRNIQIIYAQDGQPASGYYSETRAGEDWEPNWNATIEIIKNGNIWERIDILDPVVNITRTDDDVITGSSYADRCIQNGDKYLINKYSDNLLSESEKNALNTSGRDYYLIRIIGENGRYVYGGPIWVKS